MRQDRLCALFLNERHSRISIQRQRSVRVKQIRLAGARTKNEITRLNGLLGQAAKTLEALAKPPSSVLQAPYSEARIQYSEL
jgi:hypothetical protein